MRPASKPSDEGECCHIASYSTDFVGPPCCLHSLLKSSSSLTFLELICFICLLQGTPELPMGGTNVTGSQVRSNKLRGPRSFKGSTATWGGDLFNTTQLRQIYHLDPSGLKEV